MEDDPEDFFSYNNIELNSKTLVPTQGGSVTRVKLMTWCLLVPYPVQANFLSGVFSALTFVEAFEESSQCH